MARVELEEAVARAMLDADEMPLELEHAADNAIRVVLAEAKRVICDQRAPGGPYSAIRADERLRVLAVLAGLESPPPV